jgi:hypothetical protein
MKKLFKILLLLARPAAGKSEIIDHLRQTDQTERIRRYHIGDFDVIDDFPMLWTWFEEDRILSRMGYPRLHTNGDGLFQRNYFWDLLIKRICLEYEKKLVDTEDYHSQKTTIIEFARGREHGGFKRAFRHLSPEIVKNSGVLYINVSWKESLRKNRVRFNPQRPHSILEHGLTDEKLKILYRHVDWEDIISNDPHFIPLDNHTVPYKVFENEDDVTTLRGEALSSRLEDALGDLWILYEKTSES